MRKYYTILFLLAVLTFANAKSAIHYELNISNNDVFMQDIDVDGQTMTECYFWSNHYIDLREVGEMRLPEFGFSFSVPLTSYDYAISVHFEDEMEFQLSHPFAPLTDHYCHPYYSPSNAYNDPFIRTIPESKPRSYWVEDPELKGDCLKVIGLIVSPCDYDAEKFVLTVPKRITIDIDWKEGGEIPPGFRLPPTKDRALQYIEFVKLYCCNPEDVDDNVPFDIDQVSVKSPEQMNGCLRFIDGTLCLENTSDNNFILNIVDLSGRTLYRGLINPNKPVFISQILEHGSYIAYAYNGKNTIICKFAFF